MLITHMLSGGLVVSLPFQRVVVVDATIVSG